MVGAVYLALVAAYSRPIQDDWLAIATVPHLSLWSYVHGWWSTHDGRFSGLTLGWLTIRLFGARAVTVTPLLLMALLWGSFAWAAHSCSRLGDRDPSRAVSALLGLLATVAVLASAPSLFDVAGWLSGSAVYLAAFASVVGTLALYAHAAVARRPSPWWSLPLVAAGYVAGGFDEITGICGVLAAALAMFNVRHLDRGGDSRSRLMLIAAGGGGALVGTAVNLLSPGSGQRARLQHAHISISAGANTAFQNLTFIRDDIHAGVLLLAIALGALAYRLFATSFGTRARRWLVTWALFLLVVPWLLTSALTAWAGSVESGDRSPFRAAFLLTGSVSLAVALLVFVALLHFPRLLSPGRGSLVALVLTAAGTFALAHKAAPTLTAERMRDTMLVRRDASIRSQLREHRRTITALPAPLLLVATQALDLSFGQSASRPGSLYLFRAYYGIPPRDKLRIVARQPSGYCLVGVAASWVGVQSCQELHARR